ncbi:phage tail tape measure protein, partial [Rhodobacter maris]
DKAAQIRVADEVFGGTGGERFVEMLDRGEASIAAVMKRASVLTEEQIAQADELDRRYTALTASLHRGWQQAALGAADFVAQVLNIQTETDNLAASDLFRNRLQAPQILGPDVDGALKDNGQAVADNAEAISDLLSLYESFGAEADRLAPILSRFGGELNRMGETAAGQSLQDVALSMQSLTGKLDAGEISAGDFERQMRALIEEAQSAFRALGDIDDARFAKVIDRLGGLWTALEALRTKAAELRNTLPGGGPALGDTRAEAIAEARSGSYAQSSPYVLDSSPRPKQPPPLLGETGPEPGAGKRGGGRGADDFARVVADLEREKAALDAEAAALIASAAAGRDYADAVELARTRAELLTAAEREGKAITPELSAQVDQLAQSYVAAGNRAEAAADKLKRIDEAGKRGAATLTDLFTGVLEGSMSAEEALGQLLLKLAEVQFERAMTGLFTGALGGFGTWLGGALGFASGGYTGDGGKLEPAGIVHRGEFVMSKAATARLGVGNLDALHSAALRGYSDGGFVGGSAPKAMGALGKATAAPVITLNNAVTVNASGGTPEANADLARQVADQTERAMRAVVAEEIMRQMRPGGMMR